VDWVAVVAWAAVIFTFSAIPDLSTHLGLWDLILRKCAHTAEYALLAVLLVRALGREVPAIAAGVVYAGSDEIHQHFVRGRHAAALDVLIDAVGLTLGVLALRRLRQLRR
jgi:VanZ family protein